MTIIYSSRPALDALRVCSGCRLQLFKQDPSSLARLPASIPLITVRHATHGAQGRANGPKNGPGKRLGAKKTGDEYVIPGNIIFRQRGTKWFPGENVGIGRDHTLFSLVHGYVKFYRDPLRHPKRSYIGVTYDKNDTLPYSRQAPRKRRLGMVAVPRAELQPLSDIDVAKIEAQKLYREMPGVEGLPEDGPMVGAAPAVGKAKAKAKNPTGAVPPEELKMRPDYSYREANWQIGRAAERAGVKVKLFKPGDRWTAWQKRTAKRKRAIAKRAMGRKGKQANTKRRTRPMGKQ